MSEVQAAIPLPRPSEVSAPHWEGCRAGELRAQRCNACGEYVFIPQVVCTRCMSSDLDWVASAGRGSIYSFTTVHRPQRPVFQVPYTVVIVQLDEGFYMLSNLVDFDESELRIGLPVEVDFRRMSDEITLPYFRPRAAGAETPGS